LKSPAASSRPHSRSFMDPPDRSRMAAAEL
jgi:hypothetical protein